MEVKGTAIATLPEFIRSKFKEEGYQKWFNALSPKAQEVYKWKVMPNNWYPLKETMIEPTQAMCNLFYSGNYSGAFECGRYSADVGLKGIYRFFVQLGSPEFIVKRARVILPTYYRPSRMETRDAKKGSVVVVIPEFEGIDPVVEARIAGWIQRALEICGVKNVKAEVISSLTKNHPATEIRASWE